MADERRVAFKGLVHALDLRRGTELRSALLLAIALLLVPLRGLRVAVGPDLLQVKADFFLRWGDSETSSAAVAATSEIFSFLLLLTRFSSSRFSLILLSAFSLVRLLR